MYSPSRKVRASVRRTIFLITISCFTSLLVIDHVLSWGTPSSITYPPTESVAPMLNRSQMLLAKNVTLEPFSFMCMTNFSGTKLPPVYPLFIVVKTRATNTGPLFERRMFTRASWGREAQALGIPVIYAIGRPTDEHTQKMLEYENQVYGDLLQINYIDSYYNITIKTTGILNWFVRHNCSQMSPYLFLVDDDVLVNIPSLMNSISMGSYRTDGIYGLYLRDIEPHPSGKWAVSLKDFPNRTYPTFIIGASTLYSSKLIRPIVEELDRMVDRNESIFFLDDVLFTGIIPEKLGFHRGSMPNIDVCSDTDLFHRIVISECNAARRIYVWSKFILQRNGMNTLPVDQLIETTIFIPWKGDFKQMRNGTAIVGRTTRKLFIIHLLFALVVLLLLMFILVPKIVFSTRQISSTSPHPPVVIVQTNLTKNTSSMLLTAAQ